MKPTRREASIFSVSAIDLFASALGAFVVVAFVLLPYFPNTGDAPAAPVLLHVGVYGYRRDVLLRIAELEASPLERSEKLEQLRALENGVRIRVLPVDEAPLGVDTPADLALAERRMLAMQTDENP